MDLAYVWVGGHSYGPGPPESAVPQMPHTKVRDPALLTQLEHGCPESTRLVHMMAACNTVVPSEVDQVENPAEPEGSGESLRIKFEAESPDEQAFVWGAKSFGVGLTARQTPRDPTKPKYPSNPSP